MSIRWMNPEVSLKWILFIPCCNVAEHSHTRCRVWNISIKLHSCFGKKYVKSRTHRQDTDVVINNCDLARSKGIFCVKKNEETNSTDSGDCAKASGFQIKCMIRLPTASMHIFLTQNRDKLFFRNFFRLNRIKLKVMWSYRESESTSIFDVITRIYNRMWLQLIQRSQSLCFLYLLMSQK